MVNIRIMSISDYDDILELWNEEGKVPINDVDESYEGIEKYLKRNPSTSFIAEENGRIVGTIMAGHDGRRGFFHHVYISGRLRGQGIGKMLVESAMNALKKEGIRKAALVAFFDNEQGNEFWEHIGFTERNDLIYRNKIITE